MKKDVVVVVSLLSALATGYFALFQTMKNARLERELGYERSAAKSCISQRDICWKGQQQTAVEQRTACDKGNCARAVGWCLERSVGTCIDRYSGTETSPEDKLLYDLGTCQKKLSDCEELQPF